MDSSASITAPEMPNVEKRGPEFITGIELQPHYHPSWIPRLPVTFNEIANMQPNWVFLSPTWTFSRQYPPVFEPVSGVDSPWHDLVFAVERGQAFGMRVALNPTANFYTDLDSWWLSSSRDFPWWQVWFERYANFLYNFADFAQQNNVDALVIGGEWVSPALPGGTLADGSPSGVPADAESRWRTMIAEVRNRYDGTLIWALPAYPEGLEPPPFVEDLDRLYLLWSLPLADQDAEAANMETLGDYLASCVSPVYLEPPYQDDPNIELSLDEQLAAFHALLSAINERDWLDGFVARGYYPPAPLQDKSSSINGKPAQTLVADWFHLLAPSVQGDE
jgi:hypothetical protein